jgi:hypothetical protein
MEEFFVVTDPIPCLFAERRRKFPSQPCLVVDFEVGLVYMHSRDQYNIT